MKNNLSYSVITGASKGLGKEISKALARRGHNLIVVSLAGENLNSVAKEIMDESNTDVIVYECDLTQDNEPNKLAQWIHANYNIDVLVNNAGIGCSSMFQDTTNEQIDKMLSVNVRAVVILTHSLLPLLKQQKQSYILNIASLASFTPMPYKSIYPASKAFVYSFSRALYAELKGSNVFVSVVHPGGMATNADVAKRIDQYSPWIKAGILSVEQVGEICVRRLFKKRALIIPGVFNKVAWLCLKIVPTRIMLNIFRKTLQKEMNVKKTTTTYA